MNPRIAILSAIIVSLCFILAVAGSAQADATSAHFHEDNATTTQQALLASGLVMEIPAYDSGWETLGYRTGKIWVEFIHNLGGSVDDYIVSLGCWDDGSLGTYDCIDQAGNTNAYRYTLTDTSITVEVPYTTQPDKIRVRIYDGTPSYNSGWEMAMGLQDVVTYTHNLDGNPVNYIVDLQCKEDSEWYRCTHNYASWYALTDTSITVDTTAVFRDPMLGGRFRTRIYRRPPSYSSGWESLGVRPDPISVVFTHNLGGNPDHYTVRLECWDDSALAKYDCTDEASGVHALWYNLTNTTITVRIRLTTQPDAIRVRIWHTHMIYLPTIVRNY